MTKYEIDVQFTLDSTKSTPSSNDASKAFSRLPLWISTYICIPEPYLPPFNLPHILSPLACCVLLTMSLRALARLGFSSCRVWGTTYVVHHYSFWSLLFALCSSTGCFPRSKTPCMRLKVTLPCRYYHMRSVNQGIFSVIRSCMRNNIIIPIWYNNTYIRTSYIYLYVFSFMQVFMTDGLRLLRDGAGGTITMRGGSSQPVCWRWMSNVLLVAGCDGNAVQK